MSAHKSPEQKTADAIATLMMWCTILSIAMTIALGLAVYGLVRVTNDEQRTCQIQAAGLPAGHDQTAVNQDIYSLLTLKPTTGAERLAAREETPAVRKLVADMTLHLAQYRTDENRQPHGRTC